jgi:hypothetical protein
LIVIFVNSIEFGFAELKKEKEKLRQEEEACKSLGRSLSSSGDKWRMLADRERR